LKISFVLPHESVKIYGGFKVVFEYANKLAECGHEVVIYFMTERFMTNYAIPITLKKALVKTVVKYTPKWFKLNPKIKKVSLWDKNDVENADVIIATAIRTAFFVKDLSNSKGKKFYFIQGFENWKYSDDQVFETYAFGFTNIAVSKWLKELVDTHSNKESYLVSNSVDETIFNCHNPIESRTPHSIVMHYRSEPLKGAKYAFEVIEKLQKKYSDLSVTVISTEKAPSNLPSNVNYVYKASPEEIAAINNESSVFLCTTIEEGFGLPGLEALACGCVLVSTRYKGVLEYAVDGTNSILCDVKDVDALTEGVSKVFENKMLRKQMSKQAVESVQNRKLSVTSKLFEGILKKEI